MRFEYVRRLARCPNGQASDLTFVCPAWLPAVAHVAGLLVDEFARSGQEVFVALQDGSLGKASVKGGLHFTTLCRQPITDQGQKALLRRLCLTAGREQEKQATARRTVRHCIAPTRLGGVW